MFKALNGSNTKGNTISGKNQNNNSELEDKYEDSPGMSCLFFKFTAFDVYTLKVKSHLILSFFGYMIGNY